jgi:hypothetical protein
MSMELKDMAEANLILVLSSRPSLLHKSRPALTVPEWLVKVIQHFIVPWSRLSDQRRKGILTGRGAQA